MKFLLIILIVINLILFFLLKRKELKSFFIKQKIEKIDISNIHKSFLLIKHSKNLYGPKDDALIKSFNISPNNKIIGMTSDYEAWIISTLSKFSNSIFEFGTCSGKTTFLMALNSPKNSKIISLTLKSEQISLIEKNSNDNKIAHRNAISESIYEKFLFSGHEVENKITVLFENSLNFNEQKFLEKFDLIFIDGGHTYSIVKNDTEKALKMIKKKWNYSLA